MGLLGANLGGLHLPGMPEVPYMSAHISSGGMHSAAGLTSRTSSFWRSSGSAGARPMEPRATERSDWLLMRPLSGPAITPHSSYKESQKGLEDSMAILGG